MRILLSRYKAKSAFVATLSVCALFSFLFIAIFLSPSLARFVYSGLSLCSRSIIGSVFPFMVLCDVIIYIVDFKPLPLLRRMFERLFKINGYAVGAFVLGLISGFPIGAKISVDLYKEGVISRDECERLCTISNNAGPSFIIAAIGGMRQSYYEGIIIYISVVVSSILVGIIMSIGKDYTREVPRERKRTVSLAKSVRDATINTLYVCGFVVLFSAISGTVALFIRNEYVLSFIYPLLEVGGAASLLSRLNIGRRLSLTLTAFAVSFSGISVHMQAKSLLIGTDVPQGRYYIGKLLSGLFSAIITLIISYI